MTDRPARPRRLAVLMLAGAVAANLAFAGLGMAFDYPDVLERPGAEVLAAFRLNRVAVPALFLLLAAGAALLAPIAVGVGRLAAGGRLRLATRLGIAAATVQVAGLLRWPLLVPSLADQAADPAQAPRAVHAFETASTVLGTIAGETLGYLLTAAWTGLVVVALRGTVLGRAAATLGLVAAALIASGVLVPLGVRGADLANFAGYVLWSVWLVGFALTLWRRAARDGAPSRPALTTGSSPDRRD